MHHPLIHTFPFPIYLIYQTHSIHPIKPEQTHIHVLLYPKQTSSVFCSSNSKFIHSHLPFMVITQFTKFIQNTQTSHVLIQNKPPASTLFCSTNSRSITIILFPSMSQCFDCLINNMKDIPPMHFAVLFTVLYFSALSTSEDIFSLFTSMLSKQQFASSNFGST